jgi:C2H2-type zinc finger/Zinc-finger of C2H2 type
MGWFPPTPKVTKINKILLTFCQCERCGKEFGFKASLDQHYKWSGCKRPKTDHHCSICSLKFKSRNQLTSHRREKHGKCHYCKICYKKFSSELRLKFHIKVDHENTGAEKFKCEFCPKEFRNGESLLGHMIRKHSNGCSAKCDLCNMKFSQVEEHNKHVDEAHGGDKRLTCDIWCQCFKSFLFTTDGRKK